MYDSRKRKRLKSLVEMEIQKHCLLSMGVLLFFVSFNEAMGQCLLGQRALLLQMRNNLTYDSSLSVKLGKWDEAVDCCRWRGVQCDNGGRVIGLDLSSDFISGTLDHSSSLFRLRFLQRLSLADNSFEYSSPLPSGFGQLTELKHLNLSGTNFGGQIPIEFSRLSRLVTLDLSTYHQLLKLQNPNLQILVQNFSELRELSLDGVDMAALGFDWCRALSSSSLPHLQFLSCSSCNISGPLDSSLLKLQALSVIRLDANPFFFPVPEFLADFPNLTVLSLSASNLLEEIPQRIFQVSTLRTIDLSNNRDLGGSFPAFPHNGSLEHLELSFTKFSGNLPESIGNLRMLITLNLAACNFSGPIPSSLSNLSRLVNLNFLGNNFTGLLPTFSQSKSLTTIRLAGNKLTGKIPHEWEVLENLQDLDLSYNSLRGFLPPFLLALPSLHSLKLSNNEFSGQINELENVSLSPLTEIDLSSNHLEGPFPEFLFKFLGLVDLELSSNKLSGPVELIKFSELVNLTSLDLSYNNLSLAANGSEADFSLLPQFSSLMLASCKLHKFPILKNQSRLHMLDLSDNQLSGEIPNWVWELSRKIIPFVNLSHNGFTGLQEPYSFGRIEYLDLHSNLLRGKIPLPPRSAVYVDFSSNKFTSPIPAEIGNHLSSAIFFSIADNGLVGDIPQSLCNSSRLQVLDLSGNNVSGSVPSCLTELSKLAVLNLRQNKLRGNLPTSVPQNCCFETLDLSYNLLEGSVPESLMNCSSLKVLNLGNNKINSSFPCWLKNLSNLRVLVLHSNNFHGDIFCPDDGNHSWPNLQIIDIASNNFNGVLPPLFFSDLTAMVGRYNESSSQPDDGHLHYQPWINRVYYQDSISMNYKGNPLQVVKILSAFTSIDVSSNKFQGEIPENVGELRSLLLLNLSNNAFTSRIPPSFGKLKHLEALDLSFNKLIGEIPQQLAGLTFLSFLNLSYNQLEGRIPGGKQIQTFSESSFEGNKDLCGFPLTNRTCKKNTVLIAPGAAPSPPQELYSMREMYGSIGVGFFVGLSFFFWPLWICKRWRKYYNEVFDKIISRMFHQHKKNKDW